MEEIAEQDVFEMSDIELPEGVFGVVSLDMNGDVEERVGAIDEDFADSLALTAQLAVRLGETLGLDELLTIEASGAHFRSHLLKKPQGTLFGGLANAQVDAKVLGETVKKVAES